MCYDYRGRMGVWFKTLLLFVVFDTVQLYRQLMNTTCLELAKPSNKQFRLSCNDSSIYHCLLNGNSTKEFEICKSWKWIPAGNCTYINTYKWNIDSRNCSSSADLACPKTVYRSENTTNYAACYVKKNTNATARLVRNTTCLELAKHTNQQFRLSCNDTSTYHCLLDQNNTNEYEICMMSKWIPEGKCAYFSMYSGGNIDERNCTSSSHLVCPKKQYRSENTTNYSACYLGNNPTRAQQQTRQALPIILGIIVPLVSIAVIFFISMCLKYKASQESGDRGRNVVEQQPILRNGPEDTSESPPTTRHEDENITEAERNASQESSDRERNEQQPFLRNEVEDTSESPPTMGHVHENITEARKNEDGREDEKEEKSTDSKLGFCGVSKNSNNKKDDDEESTDVFDDTRKHHQQINEVENCVQSKTNC